MSKRAIAILLILLGLAMVLGVLYWIFGAYLPKAPAMQPPPLTSTNVPNIPKAPVTSPTKVVEPKADSPQFAENAVVAEVNRTAKGFVERVGSYGNVDGFMSIRDSYTDASPDVRTYLDGVRKQLNLDHPATSGSWSQTTRVVTENITTPPPIRTKTAVDVTLDVQQSEETAAGKPKNSYVEYTVSLQRQQTQWIVTHISSQPIQP